MLLSGLKVIEYATYIAAPGAAGLMADWGADVIKIEPPGGDPIRAFFSSIGTAITQNPVFDLDNRGKRSIVIDTKSDKGSAIVRDLVKDADVFLTNVRPGGLARGGLDYATLSALNPRLIYASVTGYGLEGPDVDRAGFDIAAYWSRSGLAHLTAPKGTDPFPLRTGAGDHVASLATLAGILAAVHARTTTGKGQHVDSSLLRAGTYTLGSDLAIQMRFGRLGSTKPRAEAINPISNFFQCKDGRWVTLIPRQGNGDWKGYCKALGLEALEADPRFATSGARRSNGAEIVALLDAAFARFDFADIATRLDAADLVWAPVQTAAEAVSDPQFIASGGITQIQTESGETLASPSGPVRFSDMDNAPKRPAPQVGGHTQAILTQLGYSSERIAQLLAEDVVRTEA
ncbi:MAG: hypothetical protein RLZZ157_1567 [Pseudomonadota bacterium]